MCLAEGEISLSSRCKKAQNQEGSGSPGADGIVLSAGSSGSDGDAVLYAAGLEVFIGQVELLIPGYDLSFQISQICLKLTEHSFGPGV